MNRVQNKYPIYKNPRIPHKRGILNNFGYEMVIELIFLLKPKYFCTEIPQVLEFYNIFKFLYSCYEKLQVNIVYLILSHLVIKSFLHTYIVRAKFILANSFFGSPIFLKIRDCILEMIYYTVMELQKWLCDLKFTIFNGGCCCCCVKVLRGHSKTKNILPIII